MRSWTTSLIKRLRKTCELPWAPGKIERLEARVAEISAELSKIDLFKSSMEVPHELIADFRAWKAQAALPSLPLVSVCVATYNRHRLLTERCLPSILRQTYDHLEVIVVGDACTDETEKLIHRISDPRVKFVNLSVRGPYPEDAVRQWMVAGTNALNAAMDYARGDYITHLDDDDEYLPNRLERLVSFAKDQSCDFVYHPFWWEDGEGQWRLNTAEDFALGKVTTSSVLYRSWFSRIRWDVNAYRLMEPGDWNRFRRIKYIGPVSMRFPQPLLRHHCEHSMRPRPMEGSSEWSALSHLQ